MEAAESKPAKGQLNGAIVFARALQQHGVDHVFTLLGGPIIEAAGACSRLGMRVLGVRHEVAAVCMSLAYNYVSGKRSAVFVAAGPAIANAVTGVQVAWDNCWPLLVIGGTTAARRRNRMAFQETKTLELMQPITKWASQVDSPRRVPEYVAIAMRWAWTGRPGPVYLDVPGEIFTDPAEEPYIHWPEKSFPDAPPMANRRRMKEAAELLLQAERPVLVFGKGVRWGDPHQELRQVVDTLGIPFVPSPMGRGAIPDDHPLCFSNARSHALRNADVIFLVATRVNWVWNYGRRFNPEARIIQLDISPNDIGLNRGVDVPLIGDTKEVLGQLLEEVGPRATGLADRRAESPWLQELRDGAAKNASVLEPPMHSDEVPITHHRLMKEVRDLLPRDAVVIVDGHVAFAAARQVIRSYTPASRMNPGTSGCVGLGVPYALGAKTAYPDRTVVCVTGDSAFGFNAMEMETAVRHNLPVVIVVDNNEGIAGNEYHLEFNPDSPEPVGIFVPNARYDRMMEAFGGHGEFVERPQDLRPALERAFAAGKAACVNVKTNPAARELMAGPFF